jgi:hypothetical protein
MNNLLALHLSYNLFRNHSSFISWTQCNPIRTIHFQFCILNFEFLSGRGSRNRTHATGFGDPCSTIKLYPFAISSRNYWSYLDIFTQNRPFCQANCKTYYQVLKFQNFFSFRQFIPIVLDIAGFQPGRPVQFARVQSSRRLSD